MLVQYDVARIASVLELLSDADRSLLAMIYERRLTAATAATELGCSEAELRDRLERTLRRMGALVLNRRLSSASSTDAQW